MCGSAVFLYLGAEDAGINKGIRKVGPKGAARGYGAIPEGSRDARGIFGCEESPKAFADRHAREPEQPACRRFP